MLQAITSQCPHNELSHKDWEFKGRCRLGFASGLCRGSRLARPSRLNLASGYQAGDTLSSSRFDERSPLAYAALAQAL
jgi:hypothetical protein